MCGITGLISFNTIEFLDKQLLERMASPLNYRGPDQEGYEIITGSDYQLGFAHKRLSIIDLSDLGKQPMYSISKNTLIVFNGEIYNYNALREELIQKGIQFKSHSDTEVLLNAYELYGIDIMLDKIDGMFAFALFDKEKQVHFLARDRFGEKPLYYSYENNKLSFSSDIRSFNELPIQKTIDYHALGYYFSEMCTPIENSIWNEIKKLPPAHYITFTKNNFSIEKYWNLSYKNKLNISLNEAVELADIHLGNAIKSRMVADVPVGCFLSGGIDSSLVSLYAAKNYHGKIKTFSVGFEYEKFNELPYAKEVAEKIDSEHYEIIIKPRDVDVIDKLLREYGEPFADSSQIPTYYVSKFASEQVKVVLGGDGGDEVFAGYPTYNQGKRIQFWNQQKAILPFLKAIYSLKKIPKLKYLIGVMEENPSIIASALNRGMGFSALEIKKLLPTKQETAEAAEIENTQAIKEAFNCSDNLFDSILHASIKTRMVNDYLVKTDRASMLNSLELRTPFLAKDLVEYTASLPSEYLLNNNVNKYIPKKITENYFSKEFVYRKKMGFGIPIGNWMRNELKAHFKEILFEQQNLIKLNYNYIFELYEEHLSLKKDHTHKLWIIYVLHKWIKNQ